ncbi:MAG: diaminopimelate epimerase [Crocinitomicaceae bacterium]|nr:diaminopimelate epimerase [Crocinitomicaceae bacterium]|tara:strand:+ start:15473 stop:16246 length:774 start_codon:yes stop_codon:yes gene_type:complete
MEFWKYQGAGNDFVMVDDRQNKFDETDNQLIEKLCDRRFGIGADGLILLRNMGSQLEMVYFNSDGHSSSMCGNGGRCFTAFANFLGLVDNNELEFLAIDGMHEAKIEGELIDLKMIDVHSVESIRNDFFLDTGSPHYVVDSGNIGDLDIVQEAHKIRYSSRFQDEGTNVNFVEFNPGQLRLRTYERGVENETLACGTGVTAVALVAELLGKNTHKGMSKIKAEGGELEVSYTRTASGFENIWLKGPAEQAFHGNIEL